MELSPKGAKLIKSFESCEKRDNGSFTSYHCPANVLTIGWGHTNSLGRQFGVGERWSLNDCELAFVEDMTSFSENVSKVVTVPVTQDQFDALVSFAFNLGMGSLRKSTLLRKLNKGDYAGAALEFHKWCHGGGQVLRGLVRRRASEALLFQSIDDIDFDGKPDFETMARKVQTLPLRRITP